MLIKYLTAAGLLAATAALAGCGQEGSEDRLGATDENYTYGEESAADQGAMDQGTATGEQEMAGSGQTYEPAGESERVTDSPGTGAQMDSEMGTDIAGTEPGEAGDETGMQEQDGAAMGQQAETEFAALDTDADGTLGEQEWQPGAVDDMGFEEIDTDDSGSIDREEFRQARQGGGDTGTESGTTP